MSSDDKKRYDAQIICITQLLEIFESKSYTDDDEKTRTKVVELMGEVRYSETHYIPHHADITKAPNARVSSRRNNGPVAPRVQYGR